MSSKGGLMQSYQEAYKTLGALIEKKEKDCEIFLKELEGLRKQVEKLEEEKLRLQNCLKEVEGLLLLGLEKAQGKDCEYQ